MAKITPYHQQKLESSRVGTPGVNQAGSILTASQQSNAEQLTNAELSARSSTFQNIEGMNSQNASGLGKALQEHANLATAQQNMNDEHTATAMAGQFALDMVKKRAEILGSKDYTPDQYPDLYESAFTQTGDSYMKGMNANQRDSFLKSTQEQHKSYLTQAYNDKIEYGTKNAQVAHQNMEQRMVKETDSPDRWGLTKFMISDPDMQRNFQRQYESPEAANKAMNSVLHDSALNAIDLNLNEKPQLVEDWLNSGELTDVQGAPLLSGKEVETVRNQILQNKATIVKMEHDKMEMTRNINEGKVQQAIGKAYLHPDNIAASKQFIQGELDKQVNNPVPDKQYTSMLNSSLQTLEAFGNRIDEKAKQNADEATKGLRGQVTLAEYYAEAAKHELAAMKNAVYTKQKTPEGIEALNRFHTAMKVISDPSRMRGVYQDLQDYNKARAALVQAAPYMLVPGEKNEPFFNAWNALTAGFERLRDGRVIPSKLNPVPAKEAADVMQEAERHALDMSRGAPAIVHRALNPTGDKHIQNVIDGEFIRQAQQGVDYWQEQLGKQLTGGTITQTEKRGVDNHVVNNMLKTGLTNAPGIKPPAPPEAATVKYGIGQSAALKYYLDNRTPAMRQAFKDKYKTDPEDQLNGKH